MKKNELNLELFIKALTKKTNESEIEWTIVAKNFYSNLIDRTLDGAIIKDAYYSDGKTGRVVVGKYEKKVYYEEDEYYLDDFFFLTLTDDRFNSPTSFLKYDDEIESKYSFPLELSKLHRLIQINTNNVKERFKNFFD
ncbi:hypothetical protein [Sporosarcina aquimarina]|uniref:Uncharacterized protein n=1 Tax=Sporosarcina aquimarina TaxID=114975 RepID=A0ABU4G3I5_9BACL|nr:hypothetical protein [Sporosarcina aquimarina]MDW0111522.1 hypothetical protein [Sporosarcina aquimarina]